METDPTKLNPNLHIEEINMLGTIIYTARMNCRVFSMKKTEILHGRMVAEQEIGQEQRFEKRLKAENILF